MVLSNLPPLRILAGKGSRELERLEPPSLRSSHKLVVVDPPSPDVLVTLEGDGDQNMPFACRRIIMHFDDRV